ncbi:YolD-like family protein [Salinicoccus sesuvii]|uniref:YolD-like family protein n=1 Tax=Salinicoccus sesuvii TaxID=868281 RepID=A0ABV7N6U2_9STAP
MNTKVNQETDYRKIPVEQLNSNIPQGRGMIKWQPFATMPEQYRRIEQMIDDQAKCSPPQFDNDILVMIEEKVRRNLGKEIVLRYWNNGFEVPLECKVEYIDDKTGIVIVSKGLELIHVKFVQIYEVDGGW